MTRAGCFSRHGAFLLLPRILQGLAFRLRYIGFASLYFRISIIDYFFIYIREIQFVFSMVWIIFFCFHETEYFFYYLCNSLLFRPYNFYPLLLFFCFIYFDCLFFWLSRCSPIYGYTIYFFLSKFVICCKTYTIALFFFSWIT